MKKNAKFTEQKAGSAHLKDGCQNSNRTDTYLKKRQELLVARLKTGEHAAATELVDMYYEQIYLFMRRLGHSNAASEDLTQETFLGAWRHISQLRNARSLNSWLYRIAANVSKRHWRRSKNNDALSYECIDVADGSEAQIEQLEQTELLCHLRNAVAKLPVKLRQAIVLHYMQHLTIAEAAETAEIRIGTFRSRLGRALETLRKNLV